MNLRKAPATPDAPAGPPPASDDPHRRSRKAFTIFAVAAVGLAIGGATAYLNSTQSSSTTVGGGGTDSGIPETATNPVETAVTTDTPDDTGSLPDESRSEMAFAIGDVIRRHHEAIVAGDYRQAWDLLSRRKQAQYRRESGYDGWRTNQATLRPYLDPTGVSVRVLSAAPDTGVATIKVTGMAWTKPGSGCSAWSGITWAKYEDGTWTYDPGYSTTPVRERRWKPRYSELLGGAC